MIIFELIFFSTLSFFSIYTFAGLGQLILDQEEKNFFESFFFGFIVVTFILTLLHFFIKINLYVNFLVFLAGSYYSIKNFTLINYDYKKNFFYFVIFIVFVPIYLSQKYHEDFGYYHLPYVINLFNEKIIFGMANVNSAFVHNSVWLNLMALFNLKNNFDFLTLPSFLLFIFFIIFSLKNIFINKAHKVSNYFLIVSLFYLILKFTRISEFGNDLPATLFSLLTIFYFLKYFETTQAKIKLSYFYLILSFSIFSILIKFSSIPLLILIVFIFFKDFRNLEKDIFKFKYNFIYLFICLFFLQQFIYTGCFIFPADFTCIKTSWHNEEFLEMKNRLELINKSFSSTNNEISESNFLLNFNWVPYWFNRNYPEFLENLLTMFIPVIIFLVSLKNSKKNYKMNHNFLIFAIFILIGLVFWFTLSPVYRFSVPYFLSLIFIATLSIFIRKDFSKKAFIIFISLAITFSFSKNIIRISKKDNIYFGIEKIKNNYKLLSNNDLVNFNVYKSDIKKNNENGWQGRLCWDIPFLCTYNEISVRKKNGYLFVNKLNKTK